MNERPLWRVLLRRADDLLRANPDLVEAARRCRGFGSGGEWMASVLARHRGRRSRGRESHYAKSGLRKYSVCALAGAGVGLVAWWSSPWLAAPAALLAFYAAEARTVFLFPLLADHGTRGRRAMPALVRRAGGIPAVMSVVMPLAAKMSFGGLLGGGFLRSWSLGCAAVVIWYDDLRARADPRAPLIDLGARSTLSVRRVELAGTRAGRVRLLYASDLHAGAWGARDVLGDLVGITARERPHAVLLGGDLVDSGRGLARLREGVARLAGLATVMAVPGNHDAAIGVERVRAAVISSGGMWLMDGSKNVGGVLIDATPRRPRAGEGRYRILCAHDPESFDAACRADYDLVLAGHLHGGQLVAFRHGGREYPAAWFYRWNGPRFREGATTMLVSRGCADTIPVRVRCPREVILCDVG